MTGSETGRPEEEWSEEQGGEPYARGQAGPSGFDCEGFVEAWARAFGDPSQSLPNPLGTEAEDR